MKVRIDNLLAKLGLDKLNLQNEDDVKTAKKELQKMIDIEEALESKEEISNEMKSISYGEKLAEHLQKSGQIPKDKIKKRAVEYQKRKK